MKFGCCYPLEDDAAFSLPQVGAAYLETSFYGLSAMTPEQAWSRAQELQANSLSCPVMNVMFPGDFSLTGERTDDAQVSDYLAETLEKAALFGVKKVVFGSGRAKQVPEGFPHEKAFEQLVHLCADIIAPQFEARDMVCCIEPLNRNECNIINTTLEGLRLVKAVSRPSIRLLADLYHFDLEEEPLSNLEACQGYLSHAHIASAKNSRAIPQEGDGENYHFFLRALADAGYDGEVSLEGDMSGGLQKIASSLIYLNSLDY